MHNTILVDEMQKKRVLTFGLFGLMVFLGGFAVFVHAWNVYTEKREVLLTTSFKLEGGEQRFTAFYLSAPAEAFYVKFNVSSGSIKFSHWDAVTFEDSLGYFEYHNGTAVEMRQVWFFEGNNGTVGCGIPPESVNMVIYLHFYNEDPYEKEVHLQVTKVWI
jgi:hypothetical protein